MNANEVTTAIDDDARLQVSAFVDGELDDATLERTLDALLSSDDLACFWADAHRAGDWLRSDEVVGVGDGAALLARVRVRLALEPAIVAPHADPLASLRSGAGSIRFSRRFSRRFWMRTGVPGVSVAAALIAVAWVVPFGRPGDADKLASAQPTVSVPSDAAGSQGIQPTSLKQVDPDRLSDYFAAHRDVTPFSYRGAASARATSYTASVGTRP